MRGESTQSAAHGTAFADGVHHLGRPQRGHSRAKELLRVLQVRSSWGEEASVDHPWGTDINKFGGPHILPSLDVRTAIENVSVLSPVKSGRRRLRRKAFRNDSVHSTISIYVSYYVMCCLRTEAVNRYSPTIILYCREAVMLNEFQQRMVWLEHTSIPWCSEFVIRYGIPLYVELV